MKLFRRINQWPILGALWAMAVILGILGFARYSAEHNSSFTFFDNLYYTFQLIPMNSGGLPGPIPPELESARFLIPLLTAAAAIKAIFGIFYEQVQILRLGKFGGHIIICGLSRKGLLLTRAFRALNKDVVLIELDEENEWLESCREIGAVALIGDAADATLLERAGIQRASALFAVCDSDGVNAEIAVLTGELAARRKDKPLTCMVHVADARLFRLLQEHETNLGNSAFQMELFNVFEKGARRLLQEFPPWGENPKKSALPHLLVIGLGRMGENVVIHAARSWWNEQTDKKRKLRISIIDRMANQKVESLCLRYPQLLKTCEFTPLQMEIGSPDFERCAYLFDQKGKPDVDVVYITVDDDSLGLHAGLTLQHHSHSTGTNIVIRMGEEKGLARLLGEHKHQTEHYQNIHAFGLLNNTCTPDLLINTPRDLLAQAVYVERLQSQNKPLPAPGPSWDLLNDAQRAACYQRVDQLQILLKEIKCGIIPLTDWDAPSFEFLAEEVEVLAQKEHELNRQEKTQASGLPETKKGAPAGSDPALKSWPLLTDSEKEMERQQVRTIPVFFEKAGFEVNRNGVTRENNQSG